MQVNAPSPRTIVEDRLGQVEWRIDTGLVDYEEALADMTDRADGVRSGAAIERVWLLEHPPLYTAGTSARPQDMLNPSFPVYSAGRGGQYTYHGPGQRVVYLNLDLERRRRDIRCFVHGLEEWIITALADLDISSRRAEGRIGIWTDTLDGAEAKIGAIGIRVKRWVTLHGIAINVAPDLSHFGGIVPCGISEFGVTSLAALGVEDGSARLDAALLHRFPEFLQGLSLPQCGA